MPLTKQSIVFTVSYIHHERARVCRFAFFPRPHRGGIIQRRLMAPSRPSHTPERPKLSEQQKRRCIERFQRCIHDLETFDPTSVRKRYGVPDVLALEAAIDEALAAAFGPRTLAYHRYSR